MYEHAKKALISQVDMKGFKNICQNKEYKPYFERYIYKYFVLHPRKNDDRTDYNTFYREIKDKSIIDSLYSSFDTLYDKCLKDSKECELHEWQINDLGKIIAEFEIAINKIISIQSPLANEYKCSKDEIIKYMKIRDLMIKKANSFECKTIEYRRMMWD